MRKWDSYLRLWIQRTWRSYVAVGRAPGETGSVDLISGVCETRELSGTLGDIEDAVDHVLLRATSMIGYRRILSVWRDTQPGSSVKRVIGHWLRVLEEIDSNSQSVLHLLNSMHH